jgi:hypothetical protein
MTREAIDIRAGRQTSYKKIRKFDNETFRLDAYGITTGEREAVRERRLMRISDGFKTRLVKHANGDLCLYIKLRS